MSADLDAASERDLLDLGLQLRNAGWSVARVASLPAGVFVTYRFRGTLHWPHTVNRKLFGSSRVEAHRQLLRDLAEQAQGRRQIIDG